MILNNLALTPLIQNKELWFMYLHVPMSFLHLFLIKLKDVLNPCLRMLDSSPSQSEHVKKSVYTFSGVSLI